jgi:gluconolactonase
MEIHKLSPRLDEILGDSPQVEPIATGFTFTEGPLWDPRTQSLLFSDIPVNRIYRWSEGGAAQVYREPSQKANGLTWDLEGQLLACSGLSRSVCRLPDDGTLDPLVAQYQQKRLNGPDDLVVRSDGSVYFSDPTYGLDFRQLGEGGTKEQPLNGLYRLPPGGSEPVLLYGGCQQPNGLAFSPGEKRLYLADTPRMQVWAFVVGPDGSLAGGWLFAQFASTKAGQDGPDGMKVDSQGTLYTTGPGGVWIIAPDGAPLGQILIPQETTSNLAWGGSDYRTLFITAWSTVYRLRVAVAGLAPPGARSRSGDPGHERSARG